VRERQRRDNNSEGIGQTVRNMILVFHMSVAEGPIYICSCCDQLFYRHSVKNASSLYSRSNEVITRTLLGTCSANNTEWVCITCEKYLKLNRLPPMAICNNLEFNSIPDNLPQLTNHEWRVLSPRLVFMKIHQLPVG
jgi:hypothetical protein